MKRRITITLITLSLLLGLALWSAGRGVKANAALTTARTNPMNFNLAPSSTSCATPSFAAAANFAVGAQPESVAVGDFNLDGKPDLAVANGDSANVSVLLGQGSGGFGAATNFSVSLGPTSVAVGDFNLDGKPDLATANLASDNVSVLLGQGSGGFGAATNFGVGSISFPVSVA
ncbi:MAG: FG-GAP repeat domain-containing protein, partial [Blastocatellia bacterium]